jgi:hypothetical protein
LRGESDGDGVPRHQEAVVDARKILLEQRQSISLPAIEGLSVQAYVGAVGGVGARFIFT